MFRLGLKRLILWLMFLGGGAGVGAAGMVLVFLVLRYPSAAVPAGMNAVSHAGTGPRSQSVLSPTPSQGTDPLQGYQTVTPVSTQIAAIVEGGSAEKASPTSTSTPSAFPTLVPTKTNTPTNTGAAYFYTSTPSPTSKPYTAPTKKPTSAPTSTKKVSFVPTSTPKPTSAAPKNLPSSTPTSTLQPTATSTLQPTATSSSNPTATNTGAPPPTFTHTPLATVVSTAGATSTFTPTPSPSHTPTATFTPFPPTDTPSGPSPTPTVDLSGCTYSTHGTYESALLTLINQARADNGLRALRMHSSLRGAAREHSADMACNSFVSHTGSNGTTSYDRITAYGYSPSWWGENIYKGWDATPQFVFDWWMNSTPHRKNILNPNYTHIGIGHAVVSYQHQNAYTLNFGSP